MRPPPSHREGNIHSEVEALHSLKFQPNSSSLFQSRYLVAFISMETIINFRMTSVYIVLENGIPLKRKKEDRGAWQAQSIEHLTLDLGVCGFKPHMGCRNYFKKPKNFF